MSASAEILVHVSAPSLASDDARYRRELLGFLDFEPARRHDLTLEVAPQSTEHDFGNSFEELANAGFWSSSDTTSKPPASGTPVENRNYATPISATIHGSRSKASDKVALVPGTTSNEQIRRIRPGFSLSRPVTISAATSGSRGVEETPLPRPIVIDSWKTPPSVIQDSQPTPSAQKRSPSLNSSPIARKRLRSASLPVLPQYEIEDLEEEEEQDPGENSSLAIVPPSSQGAPPSSNYAADAEALSAPVPVSSSPVDQGSSANSGSPTFIPSSPMIRAPRPPISTRIFKTHVTKSLATLTREKLPLERIYIPQIVMQTRKPHIHERGHWRVDVSTFSETLKMKLWRFLQDYVGKGAAGFGVLCALEKEGLNRDDENNRTSKLFIRVFCWGEIVGEIWNLLFIGSNRKIKDVEVCWVDAEGLVVIRMKQGHMKAWD